MVALVFVVTFFIKVPYSSAGYFNISDAIILFTTAFFGPIEGLIAGIVGCALADLASGYANFIPFTILAKAMEAMLFFIIFYLLRKTKYVKFVSFFIAPLIMVATYFVSYIVLYNLEYAYIAAPLDLLQGLLGSCLGLVIYLSFNKLKLPTRFNY